jgi:rhamnopyranosyl-N-acetylglucosaminyl-diphospho-decaprenol beta-1,3/1,4-galactofuranosyltransferase
VNLGGAAGFSLGCLLALTRGPDFVWLWDDDGYPENANCLTVLLNEQRATQAAIASPLVVDVASPTRSAFPFRFGFRCITNRAELEARKVICGSAHLFNGALIPVSTVHRFGLPDARLYIRGDEVDYMWRVRRGGGLVATFTGAVARHPSSASEVFPLLGGLLNAACPQEPVRRRIQFRNRGYIFRRHSLWHLLVVDVLRYGIFFMLRAKPDVAGYRGWLVATWEGIMERLGKPN